MMTAADFTLDALLVMAAVSLIIGWFLKRTLDRQRSADRHEHKP